jgi:hypothetical protein
MAINKELTDLEEVTEAAAGDWLHIVKVADTTASPYGTSKKIQKQNVGIGAFTTLSDVDEPTLVGKEGQFPFVSINQGVDPAVRAIKFQSIPTYQDLFGANAVVKGAVTNRTGSLVFEVFASIFIIDNNQYSQLVSGTVTLATGNATNPRIDLFVVQATAGDPRVFSIEIIEGTPAASPVKPTIDPLTQAEITFATIPALATTIAAVTTESVYDEDTGEPTEWDSTTVPVGTDMASTVLPKVGTVSILLPAYSTEVLEFTKLTAFDYNAEANLVFYMKIVSGLTPRAKLQFKLKNGSDFYLFTKAINGLYNYGFSISNADWQLVTIPLGEFTASSRTITSYDELEITFGNTPIIGLDWIGVQQGINTNPDIVGNFPSAYFEFDSDNKEIKAFTDGLQRMVIADDGKVGIGTATPNRDLVIYNAVGSTFALTEASSAGTFTQIAAQFSLRTTSLELVLQVSSGGTLNALSMTRALTELDFGTFKAPVIRTTVYTVATLPTGTIGERAFVSDSNQTLAAGIGLLVVGGGANPVPVYYSGSNWRIG